MEHHARPREHASGTKHKKEKPDPFQKEKALLRQYEQAVAKLTPQEKQEDDQQYGGLSADAFRAHPQQAKAVDKEFEAFRRVVARHPQQIVRYYRSSSSSSPASPLFLSKVMPTAIPACALCGAPRRLEFQILPQIIHYLQIKSQDEDALDFGTLLVYTCSNSCDLSSPVSGAGPGSSGSVASSARKAEASGAQSTRTQTFTFFQPVLIAVN
eukprot:g55434.t1